MTQRNRITISRWTSNQIKSKSRCRLKVCLLETQLIGSWRQPRWQDSTLRWPENGTSTPTSTSSQLVMNAGEVILQNCLVLFVLVSYMIPENIKEIDCNHHLRIVCCGFFSELPHPPNRLPCTLRTAHSYSFGLKALQNCPDNFELKIWSWF